MDTKYRFAVCSLALVIILGMSGCTGVTSQPTHPATGSTGTVAAFLTDAPAEGVVAFTIQLTGASLVTSNGVSTSISHGVQEIEMRHLQLAPTLVFQNNSVPVGYFTAFNVSFANPQITLADAQGHVTVLNSSTMPSVRLTNFTVNRPINLALQSAGSASLAIDFNLHESLQRDKDGNYVVTPAVDVDVVTNSVSNQNIQNAEATVVSVRSPNSASLQLRDTGQVMNVVTNTDTLFAESAGMSTNIEAGQYIELNAQMQSDGSFIATRVDAVSSDPQLCFSGVVAGIIQDSLGGSSVEVVVQE